MLVTLGSTVLNIDQVYVAVVTNKYEEKVVTKPAGFLGLFPVKTKEEVFSAYELYIEYKSVDGKKYKYTSRHSDKTFLEKQIKSLVTQLKGYDNELITAAFESALLGDDK